MFAEKKITSYDYENYDYESIANPELDRYADTYGLWGDEEANMHECILTKDGEQAIDGTDGFYWY